LQFYKKRSYHIIHCLKTINKETMASTGPNDFLKGAKDAAASAQTTLGQQGEKVGAAAVGVQKTVGEYVTKATDYVQGKPEETPKPEEGVIGGVKKTVGGLFK
jgi:hypothetical protein